LDLNKKDQQFEI